ncbi:MAG: ABC-2 type transport system permease protein [Myxococcota bacterium]|jgi:ABC-2 type transport system permease protein
MQLAYLVQYELRHYLTKISTHVYFGMFFALGVLLVHALGGAFSGVTIGVGGSDGNVHVDSPYVVGILELNLSLFALMVTAALAGNAGQRDYAVGMHPLVFTTPVSKRALLGSRYLGTLLLNSYIYTGIGAGFLVGCLSPFVEADRFGSFGLANFVVPYIGIIGPNLVFTSAIFFGLAALTRRMFPNYIGGVLMLVGYLASAGLASDLDNRALAVMLDPFGLQGVVDLTEYWTAYERNTLQLWPSGWLLANRVMVLALGAGVLAACTALLPTDQTGWQPLARFRRTPDTTTAPEAERPRLERPSVTPSYGLAAAFAQYRVLTGRALRDILGNRYFFAIIGAGLLFLALNSQVVGSMYGTDTWPVTYQVLEIFSGTFSLFVLIVITFYAGDLVWHERDQHIAQLVDTTPMRAWVPYLAKLTALCILVAALQSVILISGVFTQLAMGYTNLELGQYIQYLYGFQLVDWWLLCVLAMAIHVVTNHKYAGHLVLILYYALGTFRGGLGWEHNLGFFGSDPGLTYSDMNGWGWFAGPYLLYKAYWGAWALALAVVSSWLWVRGTGSGWRARRLDLRTRPSRASAGVLIGAVTTAAGLGGLIFWNTNVLQTYQNSNDAEADSARYERTYKAEWDRAAQPRITDVDVAVDLYPSTGSVDIAGTLILANTGDEAIHKVFLRLDPEAEIRTLTLDWPVSETTVDADFGVHILTLERPLPPGAWSSLTFDLAYTDRGFPNSGANTQVVGNGTFVNSAMLVPSFGYTDGSELSGDQARKRQDLEPKERMPRIDDLEARQNTYLSSDSDWITFAATVSTDPDQIAIAPGYLEREWTEDHPEHGPRRYFRYAMDAPILNFYSFLSARYTVVRDEWNGVAIEVYHHPGHEWNVQRMIDAVKKSLDYFGDAFSPYQHRQVRILEFPRYASFAQSFPNTIPYSEAIGFIARLDDPEDDIDYPFYVTAHEVAHQWWAHQVIGANVQGSTVMSETLSQYASLMVMEKEYGREHIRRFLEYELDMYLQGRATESKKELPLSLVENQPYIHYRKGSLVMYALKDLVGEEALNGALSRYLMDVRYQQPPYTTSLELLEYLREVVPPDDAHVIEDWFETITLYENKATEATARDLGDGRWEVTVQIEARKVRADELGQESDVPMADRIDIGVFGADDAVLYFDKHRLSEADTEVTVVVEGEPVEAGIDPWRTLIDRHPADNLTAVVIE